MTEPRCEMGRGADRCQNQAWGVWLIASRRVLLCDDHRQELADQGIDVAEDGWEPLVPHPVQAAIESRLQRLAAGYFG